MIPTEHFEGLLNNLVELGELKRNMELNNNFDEAMKIKLKFIPDLVKRLIKIYDTKIELYDKLYVILDEIDLAFKNKTYSPATFIYYLNHKHHYLSRKLIKKNFKKIFEENMKIQFAFKKIHKDCTTLEHVDHGYSELNDIQKILEYLNEVNS